MHIPHFRLMTPVLVTASLLTSVSSGWAAPSPLFSVLLGGNETSSGDPNGVGSATVTVLRGKGQLCFGITVDSIDKPVAAHIHKGAAGADGPVVVSLTPPATGGPGASSGCVAVDAVLLKTIETSPSAFYVNVHTGSFPAGALRGQLF